MATRNILMGFLVIASLGSANASAEDGVNVIEEIVVTATV